MGQRQYIVRKMSRSGGSSSRQLKAKAAQTGEGQGVKKNTRAGEGEGGTQGTVTGRGPEAEEGRVRRTHGQTEEEEQRRRTKSKKKKKREERSEWRGRWGSE